MFQLQKKINACASAIQGRGKSAYLTSARLPESHHLHMS